MRRVGKGTCSVYLAVWTMVRVRVFVCQCIGVDNGAGMSLAVCGQWCGYVVNALKLRDKGEPATGKINRCGSWGRVARLVWGRV